MPSRADEPKVGVSPARRARARRRRGLWALGLLLLVCLAGCSETRYLLRAGWEEAKILRARQPIDRVIADPATPEPVREALGLVLEARAYGETDLGLQVDEIYTRYADIGTGPLLHVLSASPKDRLEPYEWWYPIVGTVPYKGYFDREDAEAARRGLDEEGFDTYLRPASAFSTLGWFEDPLLSTMMAGAPEDLVATVIHEIAHNTLWIPDDVEFNESFANFVGLKGCEAFFRSRDEPARAEGCAARWRDEQRLEVFWADLSGDLTDLYGSGVAAGELEAARERRFEAARDELRGPLGERLEVYSGPLMAEAELNNAAVLARRLYRRNLGRFDELLEREGGDLAAAVAALDEAFTEAGEVDLLPTESAADPWAVLEGLISVPAPGEGDESSP